MAEETFFISMKGFKLEAAINVPAKSAGCGAVVCHPHPQYGGNMDNNVVMGLCNAFAYAGIVALRFNFSGVGKSGGELAGPDGDPEVVSAVVEFLRKHPAIAGNKVAITGYSYGAMVGLAAGILDPNVPALLAVAPPVAAFQMDFIRRIDHPLCVVAGDRDSFCPVDKIKEMLPQGTMFNVIKGADHLFRGYEDQLGRYAATFLKSKIIKS